MEETTFCMQLTRRETIDFLIQEWVNFFLNKVLFANKEINRLSN